MMMMLLLPLLVMIPRWCFGYFGTIALVGIRVMPFLLWTVQGFRVQQNIHHHSYDCQPHQRHAPGTLSVRTTSLPPSIIIATTTNNNMVTLNPIITNSIHRISVTQNRRNIWRMSASTNPSNQPEQNDKKMDPRDKNNKNDDNNDDDEKVVEEEEEEGLLDKLNPFRAGQKLRQSLDSALTTLGSTKGIISSQRRSVYYLDDHFSGDSSLLLFSERNPSLERWMQQQRNTEDYVPEILVVGATLGDVGPSVVKRLTLLGGNCRVRVLVKDLYSKTLNLFGTGVTYCQGDWNNMDSLEYAVTDVDKIIFCPLPPRRSDPDFQNQFQSFCQETLNNQNEEECILPTKQQQGDDDDDYTDNTDDDSWETLESVLQTRAKMAEQIDLIGLQNVVRAYLNVRHADYGTSQAAKRSLFKFQDRPEDFNLFAIDDSLDDEDNNNENEDAMADTDNDHDSDQHYNNKPSTMTSTLTGGNSAITTTTTTTVASATTTSPKSFTTASSSSFSTSTSSSTMKSSNSYFDSYPSTANTNDDAYASYGNNNNLKDYDDDDYYAQMDQQYANQDPYADNYSPNVESSFANNTPSSITASTSTTRMVEQRRDAVYKATCQWIRNAFGHGVFVGKVPSATGGGNGGEVAIISSRLRASRDNPDSDQGIDLGSGFAGFVCRVCSDGGNYEAFVRTGLYDTEGIEYVCPFSTATKPTQKWNKSPNKFKTVRLEFENFKPVAQKIKKGISSSTTSMDAIPPFAGRDIRRIGFRYRSAANQDQGSSSYFTGNKKQDRSWSNFYLALCYIKVYRSQPEPEFVYLSDARIPPVIQNGMVRHELRQIVTNDPADGSTASESVYRIFDESTLQSVMVTSNKNERTPEETYYKYRGEEILKNSGISYAIVRIWGLNDSPSGEASSLELTSSNEDLSYASGSEVAQVCTQALLDPNALNKSFYISKSKRSTTAAAVAAADVSEVLSAKFAALPSDSVS